MFQVVSGSFGPSRHMLGAQWGCWARTRGWPGAQGSTRALLGAHGPPAARLARARAQMAYLARALSTCQARWVPDARGNMFKT